MALTSASVCGVSGFWSRGESVGGGCPFKLGTRPQTLVKGQRTRSEFLQECFMVPFNQSRRCRPLEAGRSPTLRKFISPSRCHQFNRQSLLFKGRQSNRSCEKWACWSKAHRLADLWCDQMKCEGVIMTADLHRSPEGHMNNRLSAWVISHSCGVLEC